MQNSPFVPLIKINNKVKKHKHSEMDRPKTCTSLGLFSGFCSEKESDRGAEKVGNPPHSSQQTLDCWQLQCALRRQI